MDWAQLATWIGVAAVGAISALQAYFAKQAAARPPVVVKGASLPLGLVDRVAVGGGIAQGATGGDVAATILPWFPAAYIPAWSQQDSIIPDGTEDVQRFNNCGETCVSMIVAGVWGTPIEPASIRQYLNGPGGSGLTDAWALVKALRYFSIKAHVETPAAADAFKTVVAAVGLQRCVIMLGKWPTPGLALHWMVAVADGADVIQYVNPWTGARSYLGKDDWLEYYGGQLVVLDSHVHVDCRTWPNPA